MDLKQLTYFVTVVEQKSFSKAASVLHISQPSLSNAIKNMEDEVGFKLLERNTRNIGLTESGQLLYERALHILLDMSILEKEMQEARLVGKGELRLGMIESVKHWIPKVIRRYEEKFADMNLFLTEELSGEDVKRSLRQYKSHAVITNQLIDEADIRTVPLYKEKLVLVLHETHPLAKRDVVLLSDLRDEPFIITSEGFQTREDVLETFTEEGIHPYIQYEVERFETALSLILENLGVSLIPENYLADRHNARLVHKTIASPSLERTVYLTYLKDRYMAPAIEAFIEETIRFFR
ncbi:LysR family transcriptional regulator [Sporosarcina sp. Te-1]|uniref:LysR family transcriptional regulator n=1 Tax=Sporosarcina sp. Te-1 TaxID=2818390 RepID=UPI001A9F5C11|nr:LysR family transcriptional regulator [Sporosarcina sp. Te-1]QTD39428.1 LysR family transcriptional regulator [Sporosarcina sp. Te-1]